MAKSIYTTRMFTSWSWSRLHDWEHCAFFAKLKHLDKLPVPGSPAMDRGAAIGKMCEDFVKGTLKRLPQELKLFEEEFYELRKAYKVEGDKSIFVEQMWGFDKNWNPVAWDDWANCVLRVKMDLARFISPDHLLDVDYKTGKLRDENIHEYEAQLHLYGTSTFHKFPQVQKVSSSLAYLDLGVTYPTEAPTVYERSQMGEMRKMWDARVKPMLNDTRFEPRPNDKCRFCHFRKSNNGPCRF